MKRHSAGETILLAALCGVLWVVNFVQANLHIFLFLFLFLGVCGGVYVALSHVGRQHPCRERAEGEDPSVTDSRPNLSWNLSERG